jgi:sulfite exporter TauE/SafE
MLIDWLVLLAAATSGLLGGLHCAAMCGGIATGFPAAGSGNGWAVALQANLGRLTGYAVVGALVGGVGDGVLDLLAQPWLGVVLRMLVGGALVLVALRLFGRGVLNAGWRPGMRLWSWLAPLQRRLLPAHTPARRIALGVLWGWLPCGMSMSMLSVAWLQASARDGALTMAVFGLGTLPVMLPLSWSGQRVGRWLQHPRLRAVAATLVLLMGLLTISAPWLMQVPALHGVLAALGCKPLW